MLNHYQRQLLNPALSTAERVTLLCRVGWLLMEQGDLAGAIAPLDEALLLEPNAAIAHHYRAVVLEQMGQFREAIAHYDRAIECSATPDAEIWANRGNALRSLGRYRAALRSFERALENEPENLQAMSGTGALLALLGRKQKAQRMGRQALERYPDAAETWHSMGVVLSVAGRNAEALEHFERALVIQPNFDRALCNRGMVLARLERFEEAIASFDRALLGEGEWAGGRVGGLREGEGRVGVGKVEAWHGGAWTYRGFALMRLGQYGEAIASCDRAIALQPKSYLAALYRLASVVMAGALVRHLRQAPTRRRLLGNVGTVLNFLKYRLLILTGVIFLLTSVQGSWMDTLRQVLPIVFSIGIIAVILVDLWKHRSQFPLIWKTYLFSHPLVYVRSLLTVIMTLVLFLTAYAIAPPLLRWGWANIIFGQPGNIIIQPLNILLRNSRSSIPPESLSSTHLVTDSLIQSTVTSSTFLPSIDYSAILIVGFWVLLMMGIPFWARLEERIFRRGANTWKQIAVRSTQFGLVHLLAGIPIIGGLVLIFPGFLFACRYKYVYDRHFKRTQDSIAAQEAGVDASTADHAIYNAILVTFAIASLLFA